MDHSAAWARPLAWCLHALGTLLVLVPLMALAAGLGSLNPGGVPWRFGALGLLSGAMVLPLLGIGLFLIASVVLNQRGVVRTVGVLSGIVLLGILGAAVVFALDTVQVRAGLRIEATRAFDLAAIKALLSFGMEAVVLVTLAVNAFRVVRATGERPAGRQAGTIVVGKTGA